MERPHIYLMLPEVQDKAVLLSPILFNMFLSELLYELDGVNNGLRVGDQLYNSFACADDVSLFASTVSCFNYSENWRFNFGIRKSKCLIPRYCAEMFEK